MVVPDQPHLDAEALFRQHAPFVARVLYRLGVKPAALDDLVQEVFLLVHRTGGFVPGAAAPTTYLAGIASRLAANHRRKERTRFRLLDGLRLGQPRPSLDT